MSYIALQQNIYLCHPGRRHNSQTVIILSWKAKNAFNILGESSCMNMLLKLSIFCKLKYRVKEREFLFCNMSVISHLEDITGVLEQWRCAACDYNQQTV